jgi:hypothetical protein
MASRLALQHRYPEPPARIYAVITDPNYLRDKLRAVGGPDAKLVSREQDERGVTIVLQRRGQRLRADGRRSWVDYGDHAAQPGS